MADIKYSAEAGEGKKDTGTITKKKLKRLQAKACATLSCKYCPERRFTSIRSYDDHLKSKKHKNRKLRSVSQLPWRCVACERTLDNESEWVKHLCGRRHEKRLKEMGLKLFPISKPLTQEEVDSLDESAVQEEDEESDDSVKEIKI